MSKEVRLTTPLKKEDIADLEVGDIVYLSGKVYTARDMAHIRIMEHLKEGRQLVEDFEGAAIFHAGPVVRKKNGEWEIIVIGPTTSMRMEPFSETLLGKLGVKAIIGKGGMGEETLKALKKYCGIYLLSPPGCAVIQANSVQKVLNVHWLDLGVPEAIWVLEVKEWGPLIVAMDSHGNSIFKEVKEKALDRISEMFKEK
ncbi:fumarate hydratase [Candidatus Geothermarchaeota archaeon]|nr:MAG: fumarate hydratase [Candidatus Geothermarchaeota archaeon]